jgi:hypothetical protein
MAWILASDYVGGTGSSYYAAGTPTNLGMCWPLASWPGEAALPAGLSPPLTAVGPGDPRFAAYLPNVQNILGFYDTLAGVAPGPVSYAVCGWYAGMATDPLAGWQTPGDWAAVLGTLGWSLGNDEDWVTTRPGPSAPGRPGRPRTGTPPTRPRRTRSCPRERSATAWSAR